MNPILDELKYKKPSSFIRVIVYSLLIFITILFAIYVDNVFLGGSRSATVLYDLKKQEATLDNEVKKYKELNSALQKEYFELIGLDPDSYK